MQTYVALLRGVNVGGHKVPMGELSSLVSDLGLAAVRTFIQSGNVLFDADRRPDATTLSRAIESRFGFPVPVVIRSADELALAVENNPFSDRDPSRVHVGFLQRSPSCEEVAALATEPFLPDRCAFVGNEQYLFLPDGMARTKLPVYLERRLKIPVTLRNWNTTTTLRGRNRFRPESGEKRLQLTDVSGIRPEAKRPSQ